MQNLSESGFQTDIIFKRALGQAIMIGQWIRGSSTVYIYIVTVLNTHIEKPSSSTVEERYKTS